MSYDTFIEAGFYAMLGGIVVFAAMVLLGQYREWREDERRDEEAEKRIAQLPPLSEGWRPEWPKRPGSSAR